MTGLIIDHLIAARVVLAGGSVVVADEHEKADPEALVASTSIRPGAAPVTVTRA